MKDHFDKTFWYVSGTSLMVLLYVVAITFLSIPKENQRFVDIALAFLLGFISSNASYLTGGNPNNKKTSDPSGTTTADITATITTSPNETQDDIQN